MIEHEFTVNRGTVVDGKPEWPDAMFLRMNKSQALGLIVQLARQIEDGDEIAVQFVGTLDSWTEVK